MSFTEALKHIVTTAALAGTAAILTVMAQRSALQTVACLSLPNDSAAS
jgi:hypothetical protein